MNEQDPIETGLLVALGVLVVVFLAGFGLGAWLF